MPVITVISVSSPAIRDTIIYSRNIREKYGHPEVQFHIHYLCGERETNKFNVEQAAKDILESDFLALDLMGANDGIVTALTEPLTSVKCQRVAVLNLGPVKNKLGGYDEKRFRMNAQDVANVELFANYWTNCEGNDIESAFNLILGKYFGMTDLPDPEPLSILNGAFLKDPVTGKLYTDRESFFKDHPRDPSRQNVVMIFNSHKYPMDAHTAVKQIYERIGEFANVLPVAFNRITTDDVPALRELVADDTDLAIDFIPFRFIAGPMGGSSTEAMKLLNDLNVPFIRTFFLGRSDINEWMERISGLTVMEFMVNVFMAELDGALCTFPVGVNEDVWTSEEFGITVSEIKIVEDRLDRLIGKVRGYLRLRKIPNSEKRIAIVGYNYPPGEGNLFGGAFLDTFTSMCRIAASLKEAGYDVPDVEHDELKHDFLDSGLTNGGDWTDPDETKAIRFRGRQPHPQDMIAKWGDPPGTVMANSKGYLVPGVVKGNLFFGLQPPRSKPEGDQSKDYHDPYMPPHHQYFGFYEWIRDEFKADAVIHIGTHGTVEFLPGKEVGMSGKCYPDAAIGDIPHYYLYYMGNPSEAMLTKRRTHAGDISYMSPPYVKSGLYGELSELQGLIAEYRESLFTDPGRSMNVLDIITAKAKEMRLPEDINDLEHELDDMRESLIPKGFHIFGTAFTEEEAESFAIQSMMFPHEGAVPMDTILKDHGYEGKVDEESDRIYRAYNKDGTVPDDLRDDERTLPSLEFEKRIFHQSQECHEIRNLLRALNSEYIGPKPGDDFLRNPEIVPTGYNIVQFDPSKIPTTAAFERGAEAANNTIRMHLEETGEYPKSVAMVMWGLETSRSQGATIGQIMTYLGIRMVDTAGSFERRFEIIPVEELGRPRIDITVSICGFFRDMFSSVVTGLNKVFMNLWSRNETDEESYFAKNTRDNYQKLIEEGYSEADAMDLAVCRLFGPKEGTYGTGMTNTVNTSDWEKEDDLGNIYNNAMKHAYSLNRRGYDSGNLLRNNHKNVEVVSQIRQNVEYELIDLDHYYEYFGGLSKTVEIARGGKKAKMYITDNTGPRLKTTTVKASIEHGVRTRLLNPKWIDGMLETDYHGTQKINDRFENVLGLAATTGEVESGVFSDMEKTYVHDKELRKRLMENNSFAYINMLNRLYEAYRRKYWNATDEELEELKEAFVDAEAMAEEATDH